MEGKRDKTKAYYNGKCIIECSKVYFRLSEVDQLLEIQLKQKKT